MQALAEPLRWTQVGLTLKSWDRMVALAGRAGFPRSKSEFIRQAVDEKLDRFESSLAGKFPGALAA